ncbi:hypothetical protein [Nocardia sp. NPDC056000]
MVLCILDVLTVVLGQDEALTVAVRALITIGDAIVDARQQNRS